MKKTTLLICLILSIHFPLNASENNVCSKENVTKKTFKLCKRLCSKFQCGNQEDIYTTKKCVKLFDKYIIESEGSMPPCLPRYGEYFYENELFCYSNYRVDSIEECDPLFDSNIDQYDVIDDYDGITEYEICLMNKVAQLEVCMMGIGLKAYFSCSNEYSQPCYDEYETAGDDQTLQTCLDGIQWEIDNCTDEVRDNFYLKYLF